MLDNEGVVMLSSLMAAPIWYEIAKAKALDGPRWAAAGVIGLVILVYTASGILSLTFPGRPRLSVLGHDEDVLNAAVTMLVFGIWHRVFTRFLVRIGTR